MCVENLPLLSGNWLGLLLSCCCEELGLDHPNPSLKMSTSRPTCNPKGKSKRARTEPTSRRRPDFDTMGLNHLPEYAYERWRTLLPRQMKTTTFANTGALETLGLLHPVRQLLQHSALGEFLEVRHPTYERHTLEFLSTVQREERNDVQGIKFHLNDEEHWLSDDAVRRAFRIERCSSRLEENFKKSYRCMPDDFWPGLTALSKENSSTGSRIPHPVIRYIHRLRGHYILSRRS